MTHAINLADAENTKRHEKRTKGTQGSIEITKSKWKERFEEEEENAAQKDHIQPKRKRLNPVKITLIYLQSESKKPKPDPFLKIKKS